MPRFISRGSATRVDDFAEFQKIIAKPEGMDIEPLALPSAEFKDLVRKAFAVIVSGVRRLSGNVIVRKGMVRSDQEAAAMPPH